MKIYQRTLYLLPALLLLLLGGCASVPMTSPEEDKVAKSFTVKKDKSSIYLYRNESFGGAILMTVTLDGKVAGQTGPETYYLWEVEPGEHEITSVTENTATLKITTEPGKAYYVWQEVKMGMFMARSLLHQVDEKAGREGVMECKRAISKI
jgi:hypothetical protein